MKARWSKTRKRWQVNVSAHGKRKSFYSSIPGRKGEQEVCKIAKAWQNNSQQVVCRTVNEAFERWLLNLKARTSISNWRPIESKFRYYVLPRIGSKRLECLLDQDIQDILDSAHSEPVNQATRKLSRKTLSNLKSEILRFIKYCRKNSWTAYRPDPTEIDLPSTARSKSKKAGNPNKDGWNKIHIQTLLTVDTTEYRGERVFDCLIYAYRFQLLTGLRPGEILGLEWSDIDWKENTLYINRAINIVGEVTDCKNENAIRAIPLSTLAKKTLLEQQKLCGTGASVFGIKSEKLYYDRLKRYGKANHIPNITPYGLRHAFVSINKMLPAGVVKSILGHSKKTDTFEIYSHPISDDGVNIGKMLDEINDQLLSDI